MLRCSGPVIRVTERPWQNDRGSGAFHTAHVMVAANVVQPVDLTDELVGKVAEGEIVDWAVELLAFGSRPSCRFAAQWDSLIPAVAPDAPRGRKAA